MFDSSMIQWFLFLISIILGFNVGKYLIEFNIWKDKMWFYNDLLHREDGPAIEYSTDAFEWYLEDKRYTKEDWKLEMRHRKLEALGL